MIRTEYLEYFKDLFEGRAEISWNAWFKQNEEQLSQDLPRAAFLRLKFKKLDEAENLLRASGIRFVVSPHAKRERYYSLLHDNVLNDKGRPKEEFQRKAYDGAVGHFMDGNIATGRRILADYLRKLMRQTQTKRAEALSEMCFDGEMELSAGHKEIGRNILEMIAALPTGDDLRDFAILRARQLLNSV